MIRGLTRVALAAGLAMAPVAWSQTTMIEETFDAATNGTVLTLGDNEVNNLVADNTWNPATSFENAPGTDGPEVEVIDQGSGDLALQQNDSGSGIGDLVSSAFSAVDVRENDVTFQFEVTTGADPGPSSRKMYIYAGRGTGQEYGWRAKVEQENDKLEIEATVFPNTPSTAGEAETDFSVQEGDALPGGGTAPAGFQNNATFRVTLTYHAVSTTETAVTCSIFNVTTSTLLRDGDVDTVAAGLTGDRNLFDTAVISFADDQPGLVFDELLITYEAAAVDEGETEGATEGEVVEGEEEGDGDAGPEEVFTNWFTETFEDATSGTNRVMVDGAPALNADLTWQPASSFEEVPGTAGPVVEIVASDDGLGIQQNTSGDGKGDLITPLLPVFDANVSKLSIQFDVTTGAAPADARKMYIYGGRAAGQQYGWRAKFEHKADEIVIEATILPNAPDDSGEDEVSFSLADGASIAGGGTLEAGFANNATFRVTLVFDADPDDNRTEFECTIEDLTNDRMLRDEDELQVSTLLSGARTLFDLAVLTFADDEPGLIVDNIELSYEVECPTCDNPATYYEVGDTACLRVEGFVEDESDFQWSKVGVGPLAEGDYIGVNCRSMQIPSLQISDSGTYQCEYGASKAIYTTSITVVSSLPVAGGMGVVALVTLLAGVGVAARARRRS